jgi:hypothetical protein
VAFVDDETRKLARLDFRFVGEKHAGQARIAVENPSGQIGLDDAQGGIEKRVVRLAIFLLAPAGRMR